MRTEAEMQDEIRRLRLALEWYADKVDDCRKLTRDGDLARNKLDKDGGKLARLALEGSE